MNMRILLYYFSGTGNTAWVTQRVSEAVARFGHAVTLASCETTAAGDLHRAEFEMLGLAFPVHSSYAPRPFRAALQELPPGRDCPLFVITTAGYMAGDTAWYAAQSVKSKGYRPFLLANVLMGNNFYIPPMDLLKVTPPERQPRKLEKARRKIEKLARMIAQRHRHIEGADPVGRLLGISQRWSYARYGHQVFAPFFADDACTRCGWCVRHCPVSNIRESSDGIVFGDACFLCMRCYNFCPVQAIQATDKTRNREKYRRYAGPEGKPYP